MFEIVVTRCWDDPPSSYNSKNGHRLPGFADFTIEIHHLGNPVFKTVFGIGGICSHV